MLERARFCLLHVSGFGNSDSRGSAEKGISAALPVSGGDRFVQPDLLRRDRRPWPRQASSRP